MLNKNNVDFELQKHDKLGFTSLEVAKERQVELGACSKAVVLKYKGNGKKVMF